MIVVWCENGMCIDHGVIRLVTPYAARNQGGSCPTCGQPYQGHGTILLGG